MAILDEQDGSINESSVSIQPVVVKWGLISGAIGIISGILSGILGLSAMTMVLSIATFGAYFYVLYLAIRADRDEQLGGFASFKRVFMVALGVILLSALVSTVFNFVYTNYLNPSAGEAVLEMSRSMMEKMGLPEEAMDKAMDEAAANMKSPMNIVKTMGMAVVFGAILAAIYGAIMKKERPMFN
jgi:Protein of unknown function (DUF4199)